MDASRVRAILPLTELVSIANAGSVVGVANFQSKPLAVIDLRTKLSLPHPSSGKRRQIVVVAIGASGLTGFVADRVSDVLEYRDRDLRNGVLSGIGRPRKLVDFDEIVSEGELELRDPRLVSA